MFTFLIFFLSIISTAAICVFTDIIDHWYDFYRIILIYIAAWVIFAVVSILFVFIYSLFIKVPEDKFNEKYGRKTRFIMDEYLKFMCFLFRIKIICSGKELIPDDSRFLIVSNHVSNFDPIVSNAIFKGKEISWVAKKSLFKVPIAKAFMYKCNFLCMDREDIRQSLRVINKAAEYIKNDIVSIGIYPEGTRNKTDELMLPFKPGALKIAQKARVPIVVMTVANTEKVVKRFPLRSTKVYIDVIKIYSAEEVAERKTNDISEEVEKLMLDHLVEAKKRKI